MLAPDSYGICLTRRAAGRQTRAHPLIAYAIWEARGAGADKRCKLRAGSLRRNYYVQSTSAPPSFLHLWRHDRLPFVFGDAVANLGGALELQVGRRVQHLAVQLFQV